MKRNCGRIFAFLKGCGTTSRPAPKASKPPALIYHDLNVVERVLRDQVTSDFSVIWVDTEPEYERILRFFNRFQPGLVKRVKLYTKETPLFEQFGLTEEMNKALKSKVWLKSGGYIVINQTEALVAIDINTGKYVGKTSRLEDTIVKTNVDAIKEIVRQIRLRDLGGIIIIDFIDMDERRNRQRVMQALEEELRHDRAPSKVLQFNDFGLVAITRKRVKQSLERTIGAPCPYCQSTGYVKSLTTVVQRDLRGDAQDREASGTRRRDAARESRCGKGVEDQQWPPAERDGRTHKADDHCEERSGAAPGAVRH
jgi:Rne/Rng family ribonuclease